MGFEYITAKDVLEKVNYNYNRALDLLTGPDADEEIKIDAISSAKSKQVDISSISVVKFLKQRIPDREVSKNTFLKFTITMLTFLDSVLENCPICLDPLGAPCR